MNLVNCKETPIQNQAKFQHISSENLRPKSLTNECRFLRSKGYLLKNDIGEGSYSKVKRAFSIGQAKDVAIKIVDRKKVPKTFRERFLPREIEILSLVNHPNIMTTYEIFENIPNFSDDSSVYFVTEYLEYGDLLEYVKTKGNMTERDGRRIFRDILKALAYLHSHKIAHRDVKCENVLLDVDIKRKGRFIAKLCDFGFARNMSEPLVNPQHKTGNHKPTMNKTLLRTFCGSAAYAAPEVLMSKPHDPMAADVWAAGVVAFIMLYGKMPFDDNNIDEMIKMQLRGSLPRTDVTHSSATRAVVQTTLTCDPNLRPTAASLLVDPWFYIRRQQSFERSKMVT